MSTAFPRARHLEVSLASPAAPETNETADAVDSRARSEGSQAIFLDAAMLPAPAPALDPVAAAAAIASAAKIEASPRLARAGEVPLWRARGDGDSCLDEDGGRAGGAVPVLCPSSPHGRLELQRAVTEAVQRSDALVLSGIDRWYALDWEHAGFCGNCERALVEALRASYGEQVLPFAPLEGLRHGSVPSRQRPFAGMRLATRLAEPLSLIRSAVLAARDAARRERGAEISILARAVSLSPVALLAARHFDGLSIALGSCDPFEALLPLLCARAAMGERAAIVELPLDARPDQVRQLAALATACDADVLLAPGASAESQAALLGHRKFAALLRERYRPTTPLSDVDLLIAPRADHASRGEHLRASAMAAAALARAQLQFAVRLDKPAEIREGARLLVLAGAESLPDRLGPALRRHVEGGGDLLLLGRCERVDDEGRSLGALFPEAKPGMERIGEGRIFAIPSPAESTHGARTEWNLLEPALQKALRELLAKTPRTLTLAGRGVLWSRAYLDPERKLDVHLVNLDLKESGFAPAQGVLLQIAGAAAGGGRTGYWFSHERGGKEGERIALNPSGFSVSTVLPAVGASALLSVPR